MPPLYYLGHESVKECEKKRPNVRAVHISIGHNYYPMVAQLVNIKIFSYSATQGLNDRSYLGIGEHFIEARLLNV